MVFLTASNEMEHLVKGFEVGAVDYVTKPFNPPNCSPDRGIPDMPSWMRWNIWENVTGDGTQASYFELALLKDYATRLTDPGNSIIKEGIVFDAEQALFAESLLPLHNPLPSLHDGRPMVVEIEEVQLCPREFLPMSLEGRTAVGLEPCVLLEYFVAIRAFNRERRPNQEISGVLFKRDWYRGCQRLWTESRAPERGDPND